MTTLTQHSKFRNLSRELNLRSLCREAEIDGLLVALLARQHVLLLGLPGTNKSGLAADLATAFSGVKYFRYLMTRTTAPEEVLGIVPPKALLEREEFVRKTTGKLPEADLAFLDEIFKCNSTVLNALLSITNERIFDNGGALMRCPLNTVVGASNEGAEDGELAALDDRFLIRFWIDYLNDGDFGLLLDMAAEGSRPAITTRLTLADLAEAQAEVKSIPFAAETRRKLMELRKALGAKGFKVSDRAWVDLIGVLKAAAWLEGDAEVTADHFGILTHSLWRNPADRAELGKLIAEHSSEVLLEALKIEAAFKLQIDKLQAAEAMGEWIREATPSFEALKNLKNTLQTHFDAAKGRDRKVPPQARKIMRELNAHGSAISKRLADEFEGRRGA